MRAPIPDMCVYVYTRACVFVYVNKDVLVDGTTVRVRVSATPGTVDHGMFMVFSPPLI